MINCKSPILSEEKDLKNHAPNQDFTYILSGTKSNMTQKRLYTKRLSYSANQVVTLINYVSTNLS